MRVELPDPPWWFQYTQGPKRLPFVTITTLLFPIGAGLIVGGTWPSLAIVGTLLIYLGLLLGLTSSVGVVFARRWASRYFDSPEGKAAAAAAARERAAAMRVMQEGTDWLTRAMNANESPFAGKGWDSSVGMIVVYRRDQRVPGHQDKWYLQILHNEELPEPARLPYDRAALLTHDLAHTLMDEHEQRTAGTVEVPAQ